MDQAMAKPSPSLNHIQDKLHVANKRPLEGDSTPKAKLSFEIPKLASSQAPNSGANADPFGVSGEGNLEPEVLKKLHEDLKEGWSFQGRRKHIPKLASPPQEPPKSPIHTQCLDITPGGKGIRRTLRCISPTSVPLVFLSHPIKSIIQQESGRCWLRRKTPIRKFWCTPGIKHRRISHSTSESWVPHKQNGPMIRP
jgi:hypothetical protein